MEASEDHERIKESVFKARPMRFLSNPMGDSQKKNNNLCNLENIPEDDECFDREIDLKDKPKYFDEFDDVFVDSEDELVAGENNYIEINCFPLEPPQAPPNQPAARELLGEEEKKDAPVVADLAAQGNGAANNLEE